MVNTLQKIKKYREDKDSINDEIILINRKIAKLNRRIKRRNKKIEKINNKLNLICKHKWVPNFAFYNVYDRPKYCEICGLEKYY